VDDILELFRKGEDTRAWARYWARLYRYLHDVTNAGARAHSACLVVRFEDLCNEPRATLERVATHCQLDASPVQLDGFASRLRAPSYYNTCLTPEQNSIVEEESKATLQLYGYGASAVRSAKGC
jgi:hypothetical protein